MGATQYLHETAGIDIPKTCKKFVLHEPITTYNWKKGFVCFTMYMENGDIVRGKIPVTIENDYKRLQEIKEKIQFLSRLHHTLYLMGLLLLPGVIMYIGFNTMKSIVGLDPVVGVGFGAVLVALMMIGIKEAIISLKKKEDELEKRWLW